MAEELGEQRNLAEQRADVRDRMAAELSRYLVAVDAQMPIIKATGGPVPYPDSEKEPSGDR